MLMQNFGVTNKEHSGMLWYFLEWSIDIVSGKTDFVNSHRLPLLDEKRLYSYLSFIKKVLFPSFSERA